MNLEELKDKMDCNGYAYFNADAFLNNATEICYIPESAESLDDCFTYLDLLSLVEKWAEKNQEYLIEHETDVQSILINMFENIEWEFPSTFLDQLQ